MEKPCVLIECIRNIEGYESGECTDKADNVLDGQFDCDDCDCSGSPDCKAEKSSDDSYAKPKGKTAVEYKAGDSVSSKLGVKTVYVLPGTFTMGSPDSEQGRSSDETQHKVSMTLGFYMMQPEVTQGLYQKVMGKNPSWFNSCGSNCPVESISWFDMVCYANALSKKEGLEICYRIDGTCVSWPQWVW